MSKSVHFFHTLLFLLTGLFLFSCSKGDNFSIDEPRIRFIEASVDASINKAKIFQKNSKVTNFYEYSKEESWMNVQKMQNKEFDVHDEIIFSEKNYGNQLYVQASCSQKREQTSELYTATKQTTLIITQEPVTFLELIPKKFYIGNKTHSWYWPYTCQFEIVAKNSIGSTHHFNLFGISLTSKSKGNRIVLLKKNNKKSSSDKFAFVTGSKSVSMVIKTGEFENYLLGTRPDMKYGLMCGDILHPHNPFPLQLNVMGEISQIKPFDENIIHISDFINYPLSREKLFTVTHKEKTTAHKSLRCFIAEYVTRGQDLHLHRSSRELILLKNPRKKPLHNHRRRIKIL